VWINQPRRHGGANGGIAPPVLAIAPQFGSSI